MSKWFGWWSSRSSPPQESASPARLADNILQPAPDNPLDDSDAPPQDTEATAAEAEPQGAYAESNSDADLHGYDGEPAEVFHDLSLSSSDSDDESSAAACGDDFTDAPPSIPLAPPQLLPHDSAAAAASASSPDSKETAKDLDDAHAKEAIIELREDFINAQSQLSGFSAEISTALSLLPPKQLYKTSGANKVHDRAEHARERAKAILDALAVNIELAAKAVGILNSQFGEANFGEAASTSNLWKYVKIGGALIATTVLVSSASTFAVGALAAIPWGVIPIYHQTNKIQSNSSH